MSIIPRHIEDSRRRQKVRLRVSHLIAPTCAYISLVAISHRYRPVTEICLSLSVSSHSNSIYIRNGMLSALANIRVLSKSIDWIDEWIAYTQIAGH